MRGYSVDITINVRGDNYDTSGRASASFAVAPNVEAINAVAPGVPELARGLLEAAILDHLAKVEAAQVEEEKE